RKIADFLTAVDERIGQLIRKRDLLEEYKKGVMQQLFSQTIRFKDDNGNDFPEWEEKKLGEVGEITTGKTPPTSKPELWNGETMFVTPSDINDRAKFQVRSERRVQGNSVRLIPTNSVMFTCIGSIGKISISTESCLTNQQINSISVFSAINFEFIYYVLLKRTPKIRATQANTTLPIINKTEFSKFTIPFPSLPEQTKIANFLSAIDRRIEQVSAQISETQTFKRGLLQQMFV
ncbi:MAG: restriction endonuclease subunit S, partial [Verrucomicrobiales bacterium]|nr:restriction endonuclease subunit S [Verrucomicrobiales bacterium]